MATEQEQAPKRITPTWIWLPFPHTEADIKAAWELVNNEPKSEPRKEKSPDFGEPINRELLLGFAEITSTDKASAVAWWDANASPEWVGVLDNHPIGKKK